MRCYYHLTIANSNITVNSNKTANTGFLCSLWQVCTFRPLVTTKWRRHVVLGPCQKWVSLRIGTDMAAFNRVFIWGVCILEKINTWNFFLFSNIYLWVFTSYKFLNLYLHYSHDPIKYYSRSFDTFSFFKTFLALFTWTFP